MISFKFWVIILIPDGDITLAVATCIPSSGVELLIGAGAGPEAMIAATAVKYLGAQRLLKCVKIKRMNQKGGIDYESKALALTRFTMKMN